ncbi:protein arginine N-methyltransferase 1.6 isoform X1 [Olea europaea var. sylvestris]|uniref:protein arginine N-methyltransferase 1.6 isoform X1 n=1 Tax=Olea europaea var. sylvestris TaxID=158386 RepID=UPI000C1D878F|nr:protein arginine N-methyltransferase 1.6 isoform X1 [Olea europaea var. sylvestris]
MYNALLFWKSTLYCSRHRAITLSRALLSLSQLNPRATTPAATRMMSSSSASGSAQRIFQLKLNPLTGDSEWVVIEEEENESAKFGKQQPLLATTSYLDMLNDTPRNKAFRQAIEKAITKPCHVLDIGAGTGLLSMMAARAMSFGDSEERSGMNGMVTACESYLPMVKLMRKVLRANGMERKIRIINKRSDELEIGLDIPSRADVLVSEILDSELLGEGLIPTLQHAHEKLLVENPQTVPYRATTYGQLVECNYLWELHDLVNREAKASDGIHLVPSGTDTVLCIKRQQYAMHCDTIREEIKLLSEPFKIFDFDFWKRPDSFRETELHVKATNDGTIHAIISWWLLQLDSEGTIFYSTGPKWIGSSSDVEKIGSSLPRADNWCDHWKQTVWFTPDSGLSVCKDKEVRLNAFHTETRISYEVKTSSQNKDADHLDSCSQDRHIFLSPERIAIYGDNSWRCSMLKAIERVMQQKLHPLCLIADDSLFLTIAFARLGKASSVISLFPGLQDKGAKYLQAVAAANGYSMDCIEVTKKGNLQLTLNESYQRKVDLLIAEPFYHGNDSMLPWEYLRFWKERTSLDSFLSEDVLVMPCKGILRACAMYLPDLWQSRCCLKEIEGFDHMVVNTTLGACGDLPVGDESPCLPFFVWKCGKTKKLSNIITIMEFDFLKPIGPCSGKAQVQFKESGICHGFVLWIDWVLDLEDNNVWSTGPEQRYWKQAVKLLSNPVEIMGDCSSTEIKASFDPSSGELTVTHGFS